MSITVKGNKEVQAKFKKLSRQIKSNKKPMYKRIGIQLMNEVSKTFSEEMHEGKPWKGLSPATVEGRRKGGGAGTPRILQDTGTLRRSFVMDADNDQVRVGTIIEYAEYHEFGKGVPKRPMLPSYKRGLEIAVQVADKYIDDQISKAKL